MKRSGIFVIPLLVIALSLNACGFNNQPLEEISARVAERQLLATIERWSDKETIGVNCLMGICNQTIVAQLTLITPTLVEDIAYLNVALRQAEGITVTERELVKEIQNTGASLGIEDHTVFLMVISAGDRTLPIDIADFGSIRERISLHDQNDGRYQVASHDSTLDRISGDPQDVTRGYILFPRNGENNQVIAEREHNRQISVYYLLSSDLNADRSELIWDFDLVGTDRPPPVAPTPTPAPGLTTPQVYELSRDTLRFLTEAVRRMPKVP